MAHVEPGDARDEFEEQAAREFAEPEHKKCARCNGGMPSWRVNDLCEECHAEERDSYDYEADAEDEGGEPVNPAVALIAQCRTAADELQRMSDQIVTPNGPSSSKARLAALAFAVRWLIDDHATMSALADSLHTELQDRPA